MCNRRGLNADDHVVIRVAARNAIYAVTTTALASASEGMDKLSMWLAVRHASTRSQILETRIPEIEARARELLARRRR